MVPQGAGLERTDAQGRIGIVEVDPEKGPALQTGELRRRVERLERLYDG